jgi:wyosine [tRNA(Phe)-imidazoG37] synthetase (radical SAM superfamily)
VFVHLSQLRQELAEVGEISIDYVTFSGVAEPTLAANLSRSQKVPSTFLADRWRFLCKELSATYLGELVGVVRERFLQPVAVLTNSSLMKRGDVRQDLALFDVVVARVDAPDERLYRQINRPFVDYWRRSCGASVASGKSSRES